MKIVKKISVITLTYKNWHLLEKAIKSVSKQVLDDGYELEYIIVDDGTEDFDLDYVKNTLSSFSLESRIIINDYNVGTVASFNNAIKNSEGNIIIPLSADDEFYDSDVVNKIAKAFEDKSIDIISALRVPVINGNECQALPKPEKVRLFNHPDKLLKEIMFSSNIISGASTYYRRDVFDKIGFFDEAYRLLEDYPFYIKALTLGVNVVFLGVRTIRYGTDGVSSINLINPALKKDYERLNSHIINLPFLNFLERRKVRFKKIMTRKERYVYSWKYPEQLFFILLKK